MAISTLAAYHELVPDATSPALGANTHMLQLDKISDDSDVRQLVKVHAAAFYNHVQVVQPFEVKGAPAVRGLWLWYANGPNRTALSLAEATHPKQSRYNRPQTLVYSYAEDCGRLVVSSCLNRAMDSGHVIVPSPTTASLHMSNVDFRDCRRPMEPGESDRLICHHLARLERMSIDLRQALSPGFDQEMVELLEESLPESSAPA